jgi:DNA-binding LacI/PurR family transcriptional regulator
MAVSIKDIALAAGVSYSTVSRALNGQPGVGPQTRNRIQALATEMGYTPDAAGRSLVTRETHMLGVVVPAIADLFMAQMIQAIEEAVAMHGYGVIVNYSGGEIERERAALRALLGRRVDGIILVSGYSSRDSFRAQRGLDLPIVIVNNVHGAHGVHSVEVDNAGGGLLATEHLLALGHRRIAYVAGPPQESDNTERRRGYEQALRACGIEVDPQLIIPGNGKPAGGVAAVDRLQAIPHPATAVFCYNDATALGVVRGACARGLVVPGDLSVVGFDDVDLAAHFQPPLTTIAQPIPDMARHAVQMILDLRRGLEVRDRIFPGQLVIRESTGHPRRHKTVRR